MSKHSPAEAKTHVSPNVRPVNQNVRQNSNTEAGRTKGKLNAAASAPPKRTNANNQYR